MASPAIVWDDTPWRSGEPAAAAFPFSGGGHGVVEVARSLLGARLISTVGSGHVEGAIVEVEAYGGSEDPASHAAVRAGRTERNRSMFGPPAHAYVYRSYGAHWCLNVVTGHVGEPQAVLIRGMDILVGRDLARTRRGREPLAAGPGRLCQALAVDVGLDGHDLLEAPLRLAGGWPVPAERIGATGRVGISQAADRPLRFYVRGAQGVTPGAPVDPPTRETE